MANLEKTEERRVMMTWVLLVCTTLVIRMSGDIFTPSIALMAADLGISKAEATSNLFYFYLWLMGSYVLFGRLCDCMPKKKLLLLSVTTCLVGCVMCALAPNIHVLNIGRSLQALATGCVLLTSQVWIGNFSDKNSMLGRLAWFTLITILSPILAPMIGGFISDSLSWRYNFWLIALLCAIALPVIGFTKIVDDTRQQEIGSIGNHIRQTLKGYRQVMLHSPIEHFSLVVQGLFMAQATFSAISSFLFVQEFGVNATVLGLLFIPMVAGLIIGRFPTLYMRKRFSVRVAFVVNCTVVLLVTAILLTYYFLTGTHRIAEVIILLTVQSIGFGGLSILSLNNSMLVAEGNKGVASGFYNFMNQGFSLAGILLAQILFSFGLNAISVFQCSVCQVAVTTVVGLYLFLRKYPTYKDVLE